MSASLPRFAAAYTPDDGELVASMLSRAGLPPERETRINGMARDLIRAMREERGGLGDMEALLREYKLSTKEGLALMVLAEALLRVPDAATADCLIQDKLGGQHFEHHVLRSDSLLVHASSWALGLSAHAVGPGETPDGVLAALVRRIGAPVVRNAVRQAMRLMGNHFVLGETIEAALKRALSRQGRIYRYSFDMLGEGARTADDADAYRTAYAEAIAVIGRAGGNSPQPDRPGISVKLSALHPRYDPMNRSRVVSELVPVVLDLARRAKAYDLGFTIDAEEADRLELSLDVIGAILPDPSLAGWDGFGLAVQAYGKRCLQVIDHIAETAQRLDRRVAVRLVKGAYWDTEIKRAQERGLPDYPVFTRKAVTDLSYLAAADRLLALRPRLFPQFATHNALTVAAIVERGGARGDYEFQRLHGMGTALYGHLLATTPDVSCRTYAPVGGHRDLLAYLVRRLLENGANASFVAQAGDPSIPVEHLLRRPTDAVGGPERARNPKLTRPRALFPSGRLSAAGLDFGADAVVTAFRDDVARAGGLSTASSIVDGRQQSDGAAKVAVSPIDNFTQVGDVLEAMPEVADAAMSAALAGGEQWAATAPEQRAAALERAADLLETDRSRFIHLLQVESGKTFDDALAEVREAIDFCRYYAEEGRRWFVEPVFLPGPVGERNQLGYRARGVFVAISPWNFPLAIFVGQVVAALMAGNAVVAKPAEQTPCVAFEAVRLLHQAGISTRALHLVIGDGEIGRRLVEHPDVAGVVFTGSTGIARHINRALALKDGAIVPLIAETGGINAMIVDATALPEQVADDVVTSAFRSAGQRCSALRLLLVQTDIADRVMALVIGAARELTVGDPREISTRIGPVIDAEAKVRLDAYVADLQAQGALRFAGIAPSNGHFVAPHICEIARPQDLREEVFGPILHVCRYRADELDDVLDCLARTGYALTLGVQTRIDAMVKRVLARLRTGNVYVNRNIIGAAVGIQPFGGHGLSGTGPKAGGPNYLQRFAAEQTLTVNTAAAGGDAALIALDDLP